MIHDRSNLQFGSQTITTRSNKPIKQAVFTRNDTRGAALTATSITQMG